jgi:medium-chain acyl-[acyl-carrier-protein] hydrolase
MLSGMSNISSTWFRGSPVRGDIDLRLFCFPYAGGAAMIYRDWPAHLPSSVQVIGVELPGRGGRSREPALVNLSSVVEVLADEIDSLLDRPFAFFGHSMGALIAFELARHLRRRGQREPLLLLASGSGAPQTPEKASITYNLPDDEFIAELQRIDGTPKEALEHRELMELVVPLLRADFQLIQTHLSKIEAPLSFPITAFGGLQDGNVRRDTLLGWKEQTSSSFVLRMLPGDHFFIRSSQGVLLRLISRELAELMTRVK